ncbi:MAG: methyltransferase domain-containing protein [Candidatus Nealsonbacteria bacterium]|nr:MAG: methyltransferase domain-containing protein [Candidatus Nealsonbacteria bacterium]
MDHKELYERQYGEKKLISVSSFSFLRKIFEKLDFDREDLTLSLLKNTRGKLLDVGCGSGSLIFKARDKFDELYGIDISSSRIKKAQEISKQKFFGDANLRFFVRDIGKGLTFADKSFDVVTCVAVLEHLFDPYFVVGEINRVLKPGGIFIVEVPNIAYLKYRVQLLFGRLPVTSSPLNWKEMGWDGGHLHYFTEKTLCKLLEESGFKILKVSGCGLFANFRNFWPSLLTGDLIIKAQKI